MEKWEKLGQYAKSTKRKYTKNYTFQIIDNGIYRYPFKGISDNKQLSKFLNTLNKADKDKFLIDCYQHIINSVSTQLNIDFNKEPDYVLNCVISSGVTLNSYYNVKAWSLERKAMLEEVKKEIADSVK